MDVFSISLSPDLSVVQSATITTISSELVAVITGVQALSILETLKLSASKSYDPDGNVGAEKVSYAWEVKSKLKF